MDDINLRITLDPASPTIATEEVEQDTRRLRDRILETDVKKVDYAPSGTAPAGTRVVDPVTIGTLLVTLASSGGVLTALIGVLKDWLARNSQHSITLEGPGGKISVTGRPSETDEELMRAWMARNSKGN